MPDKQNTNLYKQSEKVIEEYEEKAYWELAFAEKIPCCLGDHPRNTRYKKLFEQTAQRIFEKETNGLDKSK
jgi:hypothetical protein